MPITKKAVHSAARWIQKVAIAKVAPANGATATRGHASYTEFCDAFRLGSPHKNRYMDLLLAAVMHECDQQGWPDLAALVVHDQSGGLREGPGDGWYDELGYSAGDLTLWRQHRDECWNRAATLMIP